MLIVDRDLELFLPQSEMGGAIGTTKLNAIAYNRIFSDLQGSDGIIDYRCIYVKNISQVETAPEVKVFFDYSLQAPILAGLEPKNQVAQIIPNFNTSPIGVTFVQPRNTGSALTISNFGPGDFAAIWIRRNVQAGAIRTKVSSKILLFAE